MVPVILNYGGGRTLRRRALLLQEEGCGYSCTFRPGVLCSYVASEEEQGFGGPQGDPAGSPPRPSPLSPRTVSPGISVGLSAALSYQPNPAHQELPLGVHHPLRKGGLCLLPDRPSRGAVAQQASRPVADPRGYHGCLRGP